MIQSWLPIYNKQAVTLPPPPPKQPNRVWQSLPIFKKPIACTYFIRRMHVWCMLFTCMLHILCYMLYAVCHTPYVVRCMLYAVGWTLYVERQISNVGTLNILHYMPYTLYFIHCTLYVPRHMPFIDYSCMKSACMTYRTPCTSCKHARHMLIVCLCWDILHTLDFTFLPSTHHLRQGTKIHLLCLGSSFHTFKHHIGVAMGPPTTSPGPAAKTNPMLLFLLISSIPPLFLSELLLTYLLWMLPTIGLMKFSDQMQDGVV